VTLADGRVTGVEALLRWEHPIFGVVAPLRFIPLAERNGLIIPIGAWVLQEACHQLAAWGDERSACRSTSRPASSARPSSDVVRGPRRFRHRAGPLCLEITETAMMADPGAIGETLSALKALACAWPSTTSAWATPRCASCAPCCRSTR
jgi:EAL domain-containing protein (putative c-di-GMP-specific phosphodiesterase class I)